MLSRPPAAFVALAAVASCGSDKDVVLTIAGDAPGAVVLFVRVVDDAGARGKVYSSGDAARPVKLPASLYLRLNSARVGAVVWLADEAGTVVAQGRTERCHEMAAAGKYEVTLAPAPDGWSPGTANRCRCDAADPLGPMCPVVTGGDAGTVPDATAAPPDAPPDAGVPADANASEAEDGPSPDAASDAAALDAAADARDAAADRASDARASTDMSTAAVPGALFGFENAGPDWTSADTTLTRDTVHTEGTASLAFTVGASGTTTLRSRAFETASLSASGTRISVDLFVNEAQTGDANTEMWVDCESAGVFGVYMGYKAIAALKASAWTPLVFKMPPEVMSAFTGKFSDCRISFQLAGKGLFRYDRMGFAP
jgi:hypothetical protein